MAAILVHCNAQWYSCVIRSHNKFGRYTMFYFIEDKGNEVSELGKTYLTKKWKVLVERFDGAGNQSRSVHLS